MESRVRLSELGKIKNGLTLAKSHKKEIEAHGETGYPEEICGFLLGSMDANGAKTIAQILPIANGRTVHRTHRFEISTEDYYAGEQNARRAGLSLLGFYHSHPDHPALPSAYDLERAQEVFPGYSYIIVAIESGRAVDLTNWVLRDDYSQFDSEPLYITEN